MAGGKLVQVTRGSKLAFSKPQERRIVKKALKAVNKGREKKYANQIYTNLAVPWGGNFYELCIPAIGTADTQRIGDRITPVNINVLLRMAAATSDTYNMVRVIIIQAHDYAFVVATDIADVLNNVGAAAAPESQFNHDYRRTYTVLYDRLKQVSTLAGSYTAVCRTTIRRKMRPITFAAGGTVTTGGGLYMIVISDSQATIHPDLTGSIRVEYTDS